MKVWARGLGILVSESMPGLPCPIMPCMSPSSLRPKWHAFVIVPVSLRNVEKVLSLSVLDHRRPPSTHSFADGNGFLGQGFGIGNVVLHYRLKQFIFILTVKWRLVQQRKRWKIVRSGSPTQD